MFNIVQQFTKLLQVPLLFFPAPVIAFFNFVIVFFTLFVCGKLLRWLLDLIPVI